MKFPKLATTILISAVLIIALAVAAALLPLGHPIEENGNAQEQGLLTIIYPTGEKNQQGVDLGLFRMKPILTEEPTAIAPQPLGYEELVKPEKTVEEPTIKVELAQSPEAAAAQKESIDAATTKADQAYAQIYQIISSGKIENCEQLNSEDLAQQCRDELNYAQALRTVDKTLCLEIKTTRLFTRCQFILGK